MYDPLGGRNLDPTRWTPTDQSYEETIVVRLDPFTERERDAARKRIEVQLEGEVTRILNRAYGSDDRHEHGQEGVDYPKTARLELPGDVGPLVTIRADGPVVGEVVNRITLTPGGRANLRLE